MLTSIIPIASSKGIRQREKEIKADAAKESDERIENLEAWYRERVEAMDAWYQRRLKDVEVSHMEAIHRADEHVKTAYERMTNGVAEANERAVMRIANLEAAHMEQQKNREIFHNERIIKADARAYYATQVLAAVGNINFRGGGLPLFQKLFSRGEAKNSGTVPQELD